jgi:asparagine synthase (glutamine-hydrolysing)
VSFSGGRDSAAVLAVAALVARREGLALPVAVTLRFPEAPGSREDGYQEEMIRVLGLPDWDRIELTSELDMVGPVARRHLRRHGVLLPPFAHFHVPVFQRASGGTVLTGLGGDEVLTAGPLGRLRGGLFRRSSGRALAVAAAPRAVRRWLFARRRPQASFPWLLPDVERELMRQRNAWRASLSDRWDTSLRVWLRTRYAAVRAASLGLLARDAGAEVVNVFAEPAVVASLARHFGPWGPVDRTAAVRDIFGDVLPDSVVARRTKAFFDEAYVADHTREFVAGWNGEGVDPSIVDLERLGSQWRSLRPSPGSLLLLQCAWLARELR